jgi:nucleoid DNA-binding protein
MNKTDIIDMVSDMTSLPKKDSKIVVDAVLDAIKNGIINDGKVSLTGFGTFLSVEKPARVARNPKTGEKVNVPARITTRFKPALEMKNIG